MATRPPAVSATSSRTVPDQLPGARVLALIGPTGVGKSAAALAAAPRLGAEVVAVDAFTVYCGMDIGTAKPSPADRARVPHHMVDVLDPAEECSVEWFQRVARQAIAVVLSRGRLPLLVGGSGLYFRSVVDRLEFPPTDRALRARVEERFAGDGVAAHAAVAAADPEAAARIPAGNLRRSVRALEVLELTGRPFSDWRRGWDDPKSVYKGLRVVGVTSERSELASRLDARVDAMMAAGLLEEVAALASRPLSSTARQAIGYAELLDHVAGRRTLEKAVETTKLRTRRYAVRQRRWFERNPRVQWTTRQHVVESLELLAT